MKIVKAYSIHSDLSDVHKILTDIDYYGRIHPLIRSTRKIQTESKDHQEWEIKERPYRNIPINITRRYEMKNFVPKCRLIIFNIRLLPIILESVSNSSNSGNIPIISQFLPNVTDVNINNP